MTLAERMANLEQRMGAIESAFKQHLEASTLGQQALLRELEANTRLTERVSTETQEIRALWAQGSSALKFFNFLMRWAKRALWIAFFIALVFVGIPYMLANNGELPPWLKTLKSVLL